MQALKQNRLIYKNSEAPNLFSEEKSPEVFNVQKLIEYTREIASSNILNSTSLPDTAREIPMPKNIRDTAREIPISRDTGEIQLSDLEELNPPLGSEENPIMLDTDGGSYGDMMAIRYYLNKHGVLSIKSTEAVNDSLLKVKIKNPEIGKTDYCFVHFELQAN